jgi:mono/diheme cytochrome c family protein
VTVRARSARSARSLGAVVALAVVLGAAPAAAPARLQAQEPPRARPAEVTDSAIAAGRVLFRGVGGCAGCHGVDGRGTERGSDLGDTVWLQSDGSWREVVKQVLHGVQPNETTSDPMPMRGGSRLDYDEVRAVAAYVWSLRETARPVPSPWGAP